MRGTIRRPIALIVAVMAMVMICPFSSAFPAYAVGRIEVPLMIQTLPALPGTSFSLDGREFLANEHGLAIISADRPGLYSLRIETPQREDGRFRFARWSDGGSSVARPVRVETFTLIEAGFDEYQRLDSNLVDRDGNPIDMGRVDSLTLASADGNRRTVSPGEWLPSTSIQLEDSGLRRARLSYVPESVVVDGVEIPAPSRAFDLKPGKEADIALAEKVPSATGELPGAAPFTAPGDSTERTRAVIYLEIAIFGALLLVVSLWLLRRWRRGTRRNPAKAGAPLVSALGVGVPTAISTESVASNPPTSGALRWPSSAGPLPPPSLPPPTGVRGSVRDRRVAISILPSIWRETEGESPVGAADVGGPPLTESIWQAEEKGVNFRSTQSSVESFRREPVVIWDDQTPPRGGGHRTMPSAPSLRLESPASPAPNPPGDLEAYVPQEETPQTGVSNARPWSRANRRKLLLASGVVGLLFVADLLFVAVGLFSALPRAAEDLEQARAALAVTDVEGLRSELEEALEASARASSLMRHPSFRILSGIPGLRADGAALRALGSAGETLAHAGLAASDAGDAVGVSSSRSLTSSLFRDGQVDLEAVAAAGPYLQEADRRIAAAAAVLTSAPDPVLNPLSEALEKARSGTVAAGTVTHRASTLLESLPSLMGADEPRRYLLAFQALGEARATGGVMVHYGIVEARDGAMTLRKVGPLESAFPTVDGDIEPILAPRWFDRSYGSQLALRQAQQTNTSPNFPVVAEVWLRMYEKTHNSSLDGVLAMDPVALQHLLGGTGPIDGGRGPTLNSENAARVLLHDSYLRFERDTAQDQYVTNLIQAFWKQLSQGDVDSPALLSGIAQAATTEHFKAYMRAPHDQQTMKELGVDGAPASSGDNVQLVFHNNYGLNKVDYYLRRRITTNVALDYDGSARVSTTAIMTNTAPPSGPISDLLGKSPRKQGINRMLLAFLLPREASAQKYVEARSDSKRRSSAPFVYKDDEFPVAWNVLNLRPGETGRFTIVYTVPDAINLSKDGEFELTLLPQSATVPDNYAVTISPPEGLRIQDAGLAGSEPAKSLSFSGTLDRETVIHTRLLPAEE